MREQRIRYKIGQERDTVSFGHDWHWVDYKGDQYNNLSQSDAAQAMALNVFPRTKNGDLDFFKAIGIEINRHLIYSFWAVADKGKLCVFPAGCYPDDDDIGRADAR